MLNVWRMVGHLNAGSSSELLQNVRSKGRPMVHQTHPETHGPVVPRPRLHWLFRAFVMCHAMSGEIDSPKPKFLRSIMQAMRATTSSSTLTIHTCSPSFDERPKTFRRAWS